ncbi:MAG: family 20 glycosylhydrolase, partial [Promethearchaeota archaeon]
LLVPKPRVIKCQQEGHVIISKKIVVRSNLPKDLLYLVDFLKDGWKRKLANFFGEMEYQGARSSELPRIYPEKLLQEVPPYQKSLFTNQGYYISSEGETSIILLAEKPRGIYYGILTLIQLIDKTGAIPRLQILDWPSMEIRGVSDENARGQAGSVDGLKRYVQYISTLKMNMFQINLEDMFRSTKRPKSSDDERGSYTRQEIREVVDHAAKFFVEVVPIQTTCGHYDNVFVLPEYKHLAEFQNVAMCFDISNPEIYDYIQDIVREEVDAWYRTNCFHMACDESWDVGKGRSKSYVMRVGIGKAYLDHYTKCYEIIKNALEKRHGKDNFRIFIYHDILIHQDVVLESLPRKNLVINYWRYTKREKYPKLMRIIEKGFDFVVSPSVMDYQRVIPAFTNSEKNTINLAIYAYKNALKSNAIDKFKGLITTSWGDFRNENLRDLRMYSYALAADVSWNVEPWLEFKNKKHPHFKPLMDFKQGFYKHVFGLDDWDQVGKLDEMLHDIEAKKELRSRLSFLLVFPKLWMHPLQPFIKERSKRYPAAITKFQEAIESCERFEKKATDHWYFFRALNVSLKLLILFCKKTLLSEKLKKIKIENLKDPDKELLLDEITELIEDFRNAKAKYKHAWEINCKPKCYNFLLNQYDSMVGFLEDIKDKIIKKESFGSPFIPAEYIYVDQEQEPDSPIALFKEFYLEKEPIKAHLQAFAINHAKIYINDTFVGEVEFRSTLSYMILEHCVKLWDVSGIIKKGDNKIKVLLTNNINSWPVLNLLVEMKFNDKERTHVYTDRSWTWTKMIDDNENKMELTPVKTLGPPPSVFGGLTWPNFEEMRRSHFTRFLGLVSEIQPRVKSKFLVKLLMFIARKMKLIM